ncbi:response regulator [Niveispirillum sp.]|uniref:response regulator n=1 Tax=Niveispirillum sp. TaxID=1917217 RepID=UPI001B6C0211|nr:response regulator [Niveispirillum sp.]MBP7337705.1 hypothetical protein [Niveispirillum sp.]
MTQRRHHTVLDLARLNVLIYEPDPVVRSVLRGILHASGARFMTSVSNPDDLLDPASSARAALIMVRMSIGAPLITAIRNGGTQLDRAVPVVAFQPDPTMADLYAGLRLGIDEFLAVPFTARAVVAKVTSVLQNPKPILEEGDYFGPDNRTVLQTLRTAVWGKPPGCTSG